jgi:hypothetical protein
MKNWFKLDTGSPVKLAFNDCECHTYGRPHCYGCVVDPGYEEQEPRLNSITVKPVWFSRWLKTRITPADVRFLAGIPESKPFRRKQRYGYRPQF